jgi:hypothetical protein
LKDVSGNQFKNTSKLGCQWAKIEFHCFISFSPAQSAGVVILESSSNLFDKSEENKNNVSFVDKIED